ncbi:MAG: hypothetical protein HY718_03155, partial [Planctomycetes bacterium]|nr:hypothetical protein [Planctomycetota bacterium]
VLICFLVSGMFIVDEKQVAVHSRFGEQRGAPRPPGLHWGLPYPIDQVVRVSTAPKMLKIEDFWLRLREEDKTKNLDELNARSGGLDPATEGALVTGDKAIWHASFKVQYKVPVAGANDFVRNVKDEEALLRVAIKEAAVAEAARMRTEEVWKKPASLAEAVKARAQRELDTLSSGIQLDNVAVPESHYPLQTNAEFLAVNTAENRKQTVINDAQSERQKKLNGMAGAAWSDINAEIEKLDQVKEDAERDTIIARVGELLATKATGEAGGKIKLAQRDREKIVNDTLAEKAQFEALLEPYKRNPELMRLRLSQLMRDDLFGGKGVSKWVLPPNDKQIVLWLGIDPKEIAEREQARLLRVTKGR